MHVLGNDVCVLMSLPARDIQGNPDAFTVCINAYFENMNASQINEHVRMSMSMVSLCKCVRTSSLEEEAFPLYTAVCMCWQTKQSYTSGCIMTPERQQGDWYEYQSLPLCLCAFVWWPSKTSIAILASHRIGLLYKNTPASILQGWSGAEGVGAAGGGKEGWTKYSSEKLLAVSCFVNSLHSLITLYFTPYFIFPFVHSQITQHMLFLYYLYVIFCTLIYCAFI